MKIIDLLAVGKLKLAEKICKGQVCEHSYEPYEDDAVDCGTIFKSIYESNGSEMEGFVTSMTLSWRHLSNL